MGARQQKASSVWRGRALATFRNKKGRNSKFISSAELMENGNFHPKWKSDFHGQSEQDWIKKKTKIKMKWNYLPEHIKVLIWSLHPKGNHSKSVSLQCGCTITDLFPPHCSHLPLSQGAPQVLALLPTNKWASPKHSCGAPVHSPGFLPGLRLMPLFAFLLLKMCISCNRCSSGSKESEFL